MGSRDFGDETGTLSFSTSFPIFEYTQDGAEGVEVISVVLSTVAIGLTFYLANLFGENNNGRSLQEDQLDLFHQIERNIALSGLDGRACVLRFICEMQIHSFSHNSIFGEMLNLLFTPKPGDYNSILEDYVSAEMTGQNEAQRDNKPQHTTKQQPDETTTQTCAERYASCPVSVFKAFQRYSTKSDKPKPDTSVLGPNE